MKTFVFKLSEMKQFFLSLSTTVGVFQLQLNNSTHYDSFMENGRGLKQYTGLYTHGSSTLYA